MNLEEQLEQQDYQAVWNRYSVSGVLSWDLQI